MKFRAEEYYQAGQERLRQAITIHQNGGNYALSMYCSGLAVECLLRAYRWSEDPSFEGRHNLRALFSASGLLQIDDAFMRKKKRSDDQILLYSLRLKTAVNEMEILWSNNLRFASEISLKAFLRRMGRLKGVKGDALKKNSSDLLEAAQTIMDRGVALWTSGERS